MKNPTSWSSPAAKVPLTWQPATKRQTQWTSAPTKKLTQYTTASKQKTGWDKTSNGEQTYFYNDSDMTYNSTVVNYDTLVNGNQINQLLITKWSAN